MLQIQDCISEQIAIIYFFRAILNIFGIGEHQFKQSEKMKTQNLKLVHSEHIVCMYAHMYVSNENGEIAYTRSIVILIIDNNFRTLKKVFRKECDFVINTPLNTSNSVKSKILIRIQFTTMLATTNWSCLMA